MYPTIYHALYDLLGVEWTWMKLLNSFGFFVALAFVIASYLWGKELKRKSDAGLFKPTIKTVITGEKPKWGDILANGLIGFLIGWKFIYLISNSDKLFGGSSSPQSHIFSSEGNWWLGLLIGVGFCYWRWREYKQQELPKPVEKQVQVFPYHLTGTLTFFSALFGILGAKLFHLFENPDELKEFFTNPSLNSFLSGLTVYGGLIVGAIGVLLYARYQKIDLWHLCDSAAPAMMIGYGIGRMGCHVSGDGDWGIVNTSPKPNWLSWAPDWFWAYDYPHNVNVVGAPMFPCEPQWGEHCTHLVPPVYPTPIYEILMAFLIFGILWYFRKKFVIPGMIMALYLTLNGVERLLIEQIRVNNEFDLLGMKATQAEIIAVVFILTGLGLILYLRRKGKFPVFRD